MEIRRKSWKFIEYRRWFFCHLLWRTRNWQVRGRLGCSDSPQLQTREGNKYVEMVQHYLKACNVVTLIHHILDLWWSMIDNDRQRVLAFPIQTCTVNCPGQICRPTLTRVYDILWPDFETEGQAFAMRSSSFWPNSTISEHTFQHLCRII